MNRQDRRKQLKNAKKLQISASNEILTALQKGYRLQMEGRVQEAILIYKHIVSLQPHHKDALFLLGVAYDMEGQGELALRYLQKAITLDSTNHIYWYHKGIIHQREWQLELAASAFAQTVLLQPDFIEAYLGLGVAYDHLNHKADAIAAYEHILSIAPSHIAACNNLATLYRDSGRLQEAIQLYRQALHEQPNPAIHSNLLLCLHYDPKQTLENLYVEHTLWARLYALPRKPYLRPHLNEPIPRKRLKIGYISADLKRHPVTDFLLPAMQHHDKAHMEIYVYAAVLKPDAVTEELKRYADHWRDILQLSYADVTEHIRQDQIDILVDLAGHTAGNYLMVFAHKPAPIQVSWIGYFDTTGIDTMDYFISDNVHVPVGTKQRFAEEVVRLPSCYTAYAPHADAPDVVPELPSVTKGYVTFGSFNNSAKLNDEVIALWASILQAVPHARLALKTKAFGSASLCDRYYARFKEHGIEKERVLFYGWSSHQELYLAYQEIDIALDPFPFSGGATSCDALWMGVPVITLPLDSAVSRQTTSYLTHIGCPEWIAVSKEDYVAIAVQLSADLVKRRDVRMHLRERMQRSLFCNGAHFTEGLEAAYRAMWERWCALEAK